MQRALEVSDIAIGEILVNRVTRLGAQGTRSAPTGGRRARGHRRRPSSIPRAPVRLVPELS
jgi:hypothetical protein